MKNNLLYSFTILLAVIAVLLGMEYLPTLKIGDHTLRKVNILADVCSLEEESSRSEVALEDLLVKEDENNQLVEVKDSLEIVDSVSLQGFEGQSVEQDIEFTKEKEREKMSLPPIVESDCEEGITCIKDYSDSTYRGIHPFYEAIKRYQEKQGHIRIAVFGDSFIEADILTSDLRNLLQRKFGGKGVGFVPITSHVTGFRPTVKHQFQGWETHAVTDTANFVQGNQGISSQYFLPKDSLSQIELTAKRYFSTLESCDQSTIFFYSPYKKISISALINGEEERHFEIEPKESLQSREVSGSIKKVRWQVVEGNSSLFYGVAMDGANGVILDNFSTRGSSGLTLASLPLGKMLEFNKKRPYDLIVLQYGLNVATEQGTDYGYYRKGMVRTINYLKKCFPNAGFLLLSVGDRDFKNENGEVKTMPGVKNLVAYQEAIAIDTRIAFWNMFEGMGGEESMAGFVTEDPPLANYDYTHINFRGGRRIANELFEALMVGFEHYQKEDRYVE